MQNSNRRSSITMLAEAGIGFDGSPLKGTQIKPGKDASEGWLQKHHKSGQYNLACDEEATAHYGEIGTGWKFRLWQARLYLRGFFTGH